MAGLKLVHVKKKYDHHDYTVKDFHLEVQDREFLVFLGASGCGKSTTLRMIAGLEEITEGDLFIGDRKVNDLAPKDRDIAMVFQNYALYPHMNVYQNMAYGLKLRKFSKEEIDKRVQEAARILSLENLLDRKPKALSGGQRQRVAIGRAIVREPQVFLMDEPLSNLDTKLRVQMRSELIKLHKRLEATFVYVTHDQTEAMTMADRIVVMHDGVIQQVATPIEIYQSPANKYVAGFIGSPSMNFFQGEVKEENNVVYFVNEELRFIIPEEKGKFLIKKGYKDKEIIFGIRPEDLSDEIDSDQTITGVMEMIENMGSAAYLYIQLNNNSYVAQVKAGKNYPFGQNITLSFDMNKAHFFDSDTEMAIR